MTGGVRDPDGALALPRTEAADGPYSAYVGGGFHGETIPFLVFRRKDGRRVAKAYHWLAEVEYDPSGGVVLTFPDSAFTVRGRNLLGLFEAVCRHEVRVVREADRATALLVPEGEPLVEAIERHRIDR